MKENPNEAAARIAPHRRSCQAEVHLLTMHEVLVLTGMSRSSLYNRLRDGEFVRPIKIGPRSVRFLASEVAAWVVARVAQRDLSGGGDAQ
jgi:prophage regulatory protein